MAKLVASTSRTTPRGKPHHSANTTDVDNDEGSGETEGEIDNIDEDMWDGLVRPDGSPVLLYLRHDIPKDARKKLQRQIENLGGVEAMTQNEANVILVPTHRFTTALATATRRRGKHLRRANWLTNLAEDRDDTPKTVVYSQTPKRAKPSTKPWNFADYRNLADYIARVSPGDNDGGRQGTKIYETLLDSTHLTMYRWAEGYSAEQLRLRYKKYKDQFDAEIRRIVRIHPEYLTSHIRRVVPRPEDDIFGSQEQSESTPRASTVSRILERASQTSKGKRRELEQSEDDGDQLPFPSAVRDRPIFASSDQRFDTNPWDAAELGPQQLERIASPLQSRLGNPRRFDRFSRMSSARRVVERQNSAGTHKFPESAIKPRMPSPPPQLSGTTLVNPSQRTGRTTVNILSTPGPAAPLRERSEAASVDFAPGDEPYQLAMPTRTAEITATQHPPGIPLNYARQLRESRTPVDTRTQTINTGVSMPLPNDQFKSASRTETMAHQTSNTDIGNAEFELRREMLRTVGAVASPSEQLRGLWPASARGESSFATPRETSAFSMAHQRRLSDLSGATSGASPRPRLSRGIVFPRKLGAGGINTDSPGSAVHAPATVIVSNELATFLGKQSVQYGFRYEEALEQYRLTKGDLRLTVQRLKNLHEAALLILEDQAEVEAGGEGLDKDVGVKQDEVDFGSIPHARGDLGDDTGREEIDDDEEEMLNSDFPPPNSAAKAYQLRQRGLSRRDI